MSLPHGAIPEKPAITHNEEKPSLTAILDGHPKSGIADFKPWRFIQRSGLAASDDAVAHTDVIVAFKKRACV